MNQQSKSPSRSVVFPADTLAMLSHVRFDNLFGLKGSIMWEVYGDRRSGNCYKVELVMALTGQACRWVDVDILKGETHTPDFLALNPAGQIPLLVTGPGRCLPESNAILHFVAAGSPLVPDEPWAQAQVLRWLFWEQYRHEPSVAVARFIVRYLQQPPARQAQLDKCIAGGHDALRLMDTHLANQPFFVGQRYTIADIALYAYTHVAEEGGIALAGYRHVRDWLDRVAAMPGHVPMAGAH